MRAVVLLQEMDDSQQYLQVWGCSWAWNVLAEIHNGLDSPLLYLGINVLKTSKVRAVAPVEFRAELFQLEEFFTDLVTYVACMRYKCLLELVILFAVVWLCCCSPL